jgi:murein DD-endopeptidase MepM/ murein hydrolase activator NlpD
MNRLVRPDFVMFMRIRHSLFLFMPFLVSVFFLAACSPVHIKTRNGVTHPVKKGETLWRICEAYGANLTSVCMFNGITDPETIRAGQRLFIPGADARRKVPPGPSVAGSNGTGGPGPEKTEKGRQKGPVPKPSRLSFAWPVQGRITSGFGARNGQQHDGIDIAAPKGTPVHAAEAGKVVYSDNGLRGYGNLIIIQHPGNFSSVYAHNSRNIVSVDAKVRKGQTIGYVGNTGRSRGDHLHFEIRRKVKPENPIKYLPPLR